MDISWYKHIQTQQTQRSKGSIIQLPNAATWLGIIPEQVLIFCASRFWNVDSNGATCIHHPWGICFFFNYPTIWLLWEFKPPCSFHVTKGTSIAKWKIGLEVARPCRILLPAICIWDLIFFPKTTGFLRKFLMAAGGLIIVPNKSGGISFAHKTKHPLILTLW